MLDNMFLLSKRIFKVNPPEPVHFSQMRLLTVVSTSCRPDRLYKMLMWPVKYSQWNTPIHDCAWATTFRQSLNLGQSLEVHFWCCAALPLLSKAEMTPAFFVNMQKSFSEFFCKGFYDLFQRLEIVLNCCIFLCLLLLPGVKNVHINAWLLQKWWWLLRKGCKLYCSSKDIHVNETANLSMEVSAVVSDRISLLMLSWATFRSMLRRLVWGKDIEVIMQLSQDKYLPPSQLESSVALILDIHPSWIGKCLL